MFTTTYGHWTNIVEHTAETVEQTVSRFLTAADPDWAAELEENGVLDDIVEEYRNAINAALPAGIVLAGSEFFGPVDFDPAEWAGYPVTSDGRLDIAAIVAEVDLGAIVAKFDEVDPGPDGGLLTNPDGYVAAVATSADVLTGDNCVVAIFELQVIGYRGSGDGEEIPVYSLGEIVYEADTGIRVDADDAATRATAAATELLEEAGWEVVSEWEYADNSVYVHVARHNPNQYTYAIETSVDGEAWSVEVIADAQTTETPEKCASRLLVEWLSEFEETPQYSRCVVWEENIDAVDKAAAIAYPPTDYPVTVYWSIVRGEAPYAEAAEPGPLGIPIPDKVLELGARYGLGQDPDVYVMVAPAELAGEIPGEQAYCRGTLPYATALRVWKAIQEQQER